MKDAIINPNSWQSNIPRRDLVESFPLPGPLLIWWETTNVCNFKCHFCPESLPNFMDISGGRGMLTVDQFVPIAQQIKAFGTVQKLEFYLMGEPFANPNLMQFVSHCHKNAVAPRLYITSNGSLIRGEKRYADICASGLNHLKVSIYGATQDAHERRTGSKTSLAQIRENILGLKRYRDERGLKLPVIYVKTITQTEEENAQFLEMFTEVADEISIQQWTNWNDQEKDYAPISKDAMLASQRYRFKKEVCPFPFYSLVIHSDLRVSACNVDWNKKAVVGDLNKQTLQEVWNGDVMRLFRLAHVKRRRCELDACKNCTFIHTTVDNMDGLTEDTFRARLAPR